jgi:hypothetical protein
MKVYQQKSSAQPLKWLIAFVLFCLVLGWAYTDVYGWTCGQHNPKPHDGSSWNTGSNNPDCRPQPPAQNPPCGVPEPTTLAMLALGLGGVLVYRRNKS